MTINFPVINDIYSFDAKSWIFNGTGLIHLPINDYNEVGNMTKTEDKNITWNGWEYIK